MLEFKRRRYHSLGQLWRDGVFILTNRRTAKQGAVSPAFRERLMLAVTSVNRCRYCAYGHSRAALLAGVCKEEADTLLAGAVTDCPEEEIPALLYAQHWAETNANPDTEARQRLVEVYGADTARSIETVLRSIRLGNLMGNTLDYLLYRISGGRWGLHEWGDGIQCESPKSVAPS
ncbi:MAG: carboxymuconolactone decarboxylase family protein [Chloroflexota bacterium]|nr:carboxymuconolactone decarboxylase family protein [Chloroflexota bacterium]